LQRTEVIAIVPPPVPIDETQQPLEVIPVLGPWVRGALVGAALGMAAVFAVALWLDPYQADGAARRMETHRQLGLPPSTFYLTTGLPCPACGMTTSFALLVRGDVLNSLRANAVGTLLAAFCLLFIPWSLTSAAAQRPLFIRSMERAFTLVVIGFLVLMFLRWVIVLSLGWWSGAAARL
jgi:hypothetical protein